MLSKISMYMNRPFSYFLLFSYSIVFFVSCSKQENIPLSVLKKLELEPHQTGLNIYNNSSYIIKSFLVDVDSYEIHAHYPDNSESKHRYIDSSSRFRQKIIDTLFIFQNRKYQCILDERYTGKPFENSMYQIKGYDNRMIKKGKRINPFDQDKKLPSYLRRGHLADVYRKARNKHFYRYTTNIKITKIIGRKTIQE